MNIPRASRDDCDVAVPRLRKTTAISPDMIREALEYVSFADVRGARHCASIPNHIHADSSDQFSQINVTKSLKVRVDRVHLFFSLGSPSRTWALNHSPLHLIDRDLVVAATARPRRARPSPGNGPFSQKTNFLWTILVRFFYEPLGTWGKVLLRSLVCLVVNCFQRCCIRAI